MSNYMIILPLITHTAIYIILALTCSSFTLLWIKHNCWIKNKNERKYKWCLHVHHHAHKMSVRELFLKYPLKCVCVEKMHKNSSVLNKHTDHLQHKSAEKRNGWVCTWRQQLDLFWSVCFLPIREENVVATKGMGFWKLGRIFCR
jgi:hypothetical protein